MKTESTLLITSATPCAGRYGPFHAAGLNPDTYITDTFPEIKGKNEFPAILARLGFLARTNARMGGGIFIIVYDTNHLYETQSTTHIHRSPFAPSPAARTVEDVGRDL